MKEYWQADNRDFAEMYTLNLLRGTLDEMQKRKMQPTCKELLKLIEETVQKEEERLNKSFPNKAR